MLAAALAGGGVRGASAGEIPILVYHRFGPVVADSMTVTTAVLESQLRTLDDLGYEVIPLRRWVEFRLGGAPPPPPHSVVLTADDGHRSVYTEMLPVVRRHQVPVTLFVYPSAISRADYALTWNQLRELVQTGLFDVQSHSLWHPHFGKEKRRLAPAAYDRFVDTQLRGSIAILERELGRRVDLLAWPFGIHDEDLTRRAAAAGYVAAFTLEPRHASVNDHPMSIPRYLVTDAWRGRAFEGRLLGGAR